MAKKRFKSLPLSRQLVGFIGLGNMGAPMANNLLQKGHKLVVYDIMESAVSQAVSAGAVKATSPAEVGMLQYCTFCFKILRYFVPGC